MSSTHSIDAPAEADAVMTFLRERGVLPVEAAKILAIAIAALADNESAIDEIVAFMRQAFHAIQQDRKGKMS